MKKLLIIVLLATSSVAVFAQGKIGFANDSLHLYYLDPDPGHLYPADAALAGQPIPVGGILPSGSTLLVDLYGGTNFSSLSLIATTTFSGITPGRQNNSGIILPAIPGGVPAYFQVLIRDSTIPAGVPPWIWSTFYFSFSEVFTLIPSSSIAYNSMVNPVYSTWANGSYDLGAAGFGAVMFPTYIPEPNTFSLIGLGLVGALFSRLRKG